MLISKCAVSPSTVARMGCWGFGFCEGDADLDLLGDIGGECGIELSPTSDEEDAQLKEELGKRLDEIVKGYYQNAKERKEKVFYCSWSYALLLVIHVAMDNDVAISDEVRELGRKRLKVLDDYKRKQMRENLAGYRPGEPLPSSSKDLFETAMESAAKRSEEATAAGEKAPENSDQKSQGWHGLNVFPPPIHGSD